jgi:hypothetical protein
MNLILLTTLLFYQSKQVYVILGGSSAANYNNFNYTGTNKDVLSYDNGNWKIASNPMPGGDGKLGSPWPEVGNKLNTNLNEPIYFVDCARINASLIDWKENSSYFNLAQKCFDIAKNISINYNVIWQEGGKDNVYSINSNYFINTILGMRKPKSNWFISIDTYTYNSANYKYTNDKYRINKLEDIYYLTNNYPDIYLGANLDSLCIKKNKNITNINNKLVDLWTKSLINKRNALSIDDIYSECLNIKYFDYFIFLVIISLFMFSGCIYAFYYYKRRKEYRRLNNVPHI